jgi:cellulose synthase/poly-beta-1,6-N-acetylglucosamine synthase-like glycosyltransferase
VYVIADNCNDSTADVARAAGARVLKRTDSRKRGKGYALNYGFKEILTDGVDAVIVVDADSVVSGNLIDSVARHLAAGADAVQCRYRVLARTSGIRSRLMDLAFLGFNVVRPLGRDRLGLSAGVLGNGFALSTALLRAVPYEAGSIVEDLEYHLLLVKAGYRVKFADDATVFGEMPERNDAASTQRSRWEGGRLRMLLEWGPRLMRAVLAGDKTSIEPLLDLATLPLAYHALLVGLLAVVGSAPLRWWSAAQFAVLLFHVFTSASKGDGFPRNLNVLLVGPFYILWKLALLPRIVRASRPGTGWIRTGRGASL